MGLLDGVAGDVEAGEVDDGEVADVVEGEAVLALRDKVVPVVEEVGPDGVGEVTPLVDGNPGGDNGREGLVLVEDGVRRRGLPKVGVVERVAERDEEVLGGDEVRRALPQKAKAKRPAPAWRGPAGGRA